MSEYSLPDSDSPAEPASAGGISGRQLTLVKKGERYVFRYNEGDESKMLAHLVNLVRSGQSDLDWFDAAVLSHQMGQRLSHKLERIHKA